MMPEQFHWSSNGSIVIPASKVKMLLVFVGAALFVAIGFWMLALNKEIGFSIFMTLIATLSILFFGAVAMSSFTKLFTSLKYGLKINAEGIDDRSSGASIGLVPWAQIIDFKVLKVNSTKFILIYIIDPQLFINEQSVTKRLILKANYKTYGTPISISAVGLSCKFSVLLKIIEEAFQRYK